MVIILKLSTNYLQNFYICKLISFITKQSQPLNKSLSVKIHHELEYFVPTGMVIIEGMLATEEKKLITSQSKKNLYYV